MKQVLLSGLVSAAVTAVSALSLADACTESHVWNSLSPIDGIEYCSATASPVHGLSVDTNENFPAASNRDVCNVTVTYTHTGKGDNITVWYYLPSPAQYKNRFLASGGGGFAINSGIWGLRAGLAYGAVSGCTDGGFGSFGGDLTDVILKGNGSVNYDALYSFGYLSIHEMTLIGQRLSKNFYKSPSKLYSYFQGCSEGGREGWSQLQRYGDQFDGASLGAPAFRQAYQQPQHNWPQIFEVMNGYVPSVCELLQISNDVIDACDVLDGKRDGVVSRSDLCRLQHNATSSIGNHFSCDAGWDGPAIHGNVSAEAVAVYQTMIDGPVDSKGRHLYVGYQPGSDLSWNGGGTYDAESDNYLPEPAGFGVQWVNLFLKEIESESLSLRGSTGDTLRTWILEGLQKYSGVLETTWTDLEDLRDAGGKVIHWHGEADNSIPTDSSALYFEQVRKTMYGDLPYIESLAKLNEFYRFYIIRGAQHCAPRDENAPFPNTVLGSVIDWVEHDIVPRRLNATFLSGDRQGETEGLCSFPTRPMWSANSSTTAAPQCIMPGQDAYDSWFPKLNSIPFNAYGDA
ncbi:putative tannase [Polychaeton citri CBS 116435]|uniref:Carboxylic ester hydrolase n=1 Tax=Polychaeton citri CBS 116435 TaxID=1314669 RepID=A0A9P4UJ63_9PEZI|nr:putative tannase [Polychaeton citri CBS 116435]